MAPSGTQEGRVNSSSQNWRDVQQNSQPSLLWYLMLILYFNWEVNHRSAQKNGVGVECMRGEKCLLSFKGQAHIKRDRKNVGERLSSCGNQAEADKAAFFFLLPLYLPFLHTVSPVFVYPVFLPLTDCSFQKCLLITLPRLVLSSRLCLSFSVSSLRRQQGCCPTYLLGSLKQLPSALWDLMTFVYVCVYVWTLYGQNSMSPLYSQAVFQG